MIANYIHVMKKYSDFKGRASVKEYWQFVVLHLVIWIFLVSIITVIDLGPIFNMLVYMGYPLFGFIPHLAVATRRLHDTNRSGWWMLLALVPLIGIILIVFLALAGNPEINIYGPSSRKTEPVF